MATAFMDIELAPFKRKHYESRSLRGKTNNENVTTCKKSVESVRHTGVRKKRATSDHFLTIGRERGVQSIRSLWLLLLFHPNEGGFQNKPNFNNI